MKSSHRDDDEEQEVYDERSSHRDDDYYEEQDEDDEKGFETVWVQFETPFDESSPSSSRSEATPNDKEEESGLYTQRTRWIRLISLILCLMGTIAILTAITVAFISRGNTKNSSTRQDQLNNQGSFPIAPAPSVPTIMPVTLNQPTTLSVGQPGGENNNTPPSASTIRSPAPTVAPTTLRTSTNPPTILPPLQEGSNTATTPAPTRSPPRTPSPTPGPTSDVQMTPMPVVVAAPPPPTVRPTTPAPTPSPSASTQEPTSTPTRAATRRPTMQPTVFPPTMRPTTVAPTVAPVLTVRPPVVQAAPTTASTETTTDTLESLQVQYAYRENITISFSYPSNDEPSVADWIGIYPTSNMEDLDQDSGFLFTCNTMTLCEDTQNLPRSGQVVFGPRPGGKWPLEPDTYQAVFIRGTREPFHILATSQIITVNPDKILHQINPVLEAVETELRNAMAQDVTLTAKFVRLAFHDCTGGCDGCVDLDFHENDGLQVPLAVLDPIVARHETSDVSRADIWALAYLLAADVAQSRSSIKVDFGMQYVGRKNCEDRFEQCLDKNGFVRACSSTLGPHVDLPLPDITTEDLFHFFAQEFSFTVQETVALMGAHTLGSLERTNTGFPGPNGWVRDNLKLDNDYYKELVGTGPGGRQAPLEDLIENAPPWFRFDIDNSDLPDIADRHAWHAFPPAFDGSGPEEIIMLNADVSAS